MGNYQARFCRAVEGGTPSLTLIVAAAQVMINWARGLERASSNVDGSGSTSCNSMKQLAQAKRQKRLVNDLLRETPGSACDRE